MQSTRRLRSFAHRSNALEHTPVQQTSPIFKLHDDVLVAIFSEIVGRQLSPLPLSQVCRRWRTVARACATLWTRIDIQTLRQAKAFVQLSQSAALHVRCDTVAAGLPVKSLKWLWSKAPQFHKLEVRGCAPTIQHILEKLPGELPIMADMRLCGVSSMEEINHRIQVGLPVNMPKLVKLELNLRLLRGVRVSTQNVAAALRHAPALEEAAFVGVRFTDLIDYQYGCSGAKCQTNLRKLTLEIVGTAAQAFFLDILPLPSVALVLDEHTPILDTMVGLLPIDAPWNTILHSAVAARLGGIKFTAVSFEFGTLELTEDAVTDTPAERGALKLCVHAPVGMSFAELLDQQTAMFDLSHIQTIGVYLLRFGEHSRAQNSVPAWQASVTKVILGEVWFHRSFIPHLPALRELHVLGPINLSGFTDLSHWLRVRNDPGTSDEPHPVHSAPVTVRLRRMGHWLRGSGKEIKQLLSVPGVQLDSE